MNINIKSTNVELLPDVHDYLNKKVSAFEKLINKKDESVALHVILGKVTRHHQKGDIFKAEMNLHISGKVFQASAEEQDLFTAIDIVKDEILKELRTHKDKKIGAIKKVVAKSRIYSRVLINNSSSSNLRVFHIRQLQKLLF